ncbi:MAG TPA: hypothetical protein VJ870_01015 [Amycolatopsis sp.]|nr:hypothetical protein [Amycolatopsis sp.]
MPREPQSDGWEDEVPGVLAHALIAYFLILYSGRIVLLLLGGAALRRGWKRVPYAGLHELYLSPLTRPVSVLLPVGAGSREVARAVRGLLGLRYPVFEVVVIDSGLSGEAFAELHAAFDLVEMRCAMPHDIAVRGRVRSVHIARRLGPRLLVVRKERDDHGDALNSGLNFARFPLVAVSDPGYLLEPRTLLWAAKPFMDDPLRVAGTAVAVRRRGRAARVAHALSLLGDAGRSWFGWPALGACFRMLSRDAVLAAGGFARGEIGILARMSRAPHRFVFVTEAVVTASGGIGWHVWLRRGWQAIVRPRFLAGTPRAGTFGLVVLPGWVVFGYLAPFAGLGGVALLCAGAIDGGLAWWLVAAAIGYGFSVVALAVLLLPGGHTDEDAVRRMVPGHHRTRSDERPGAHEESL